MIADDASLLLAFIEMMLKVMFAYRHTAQPPMPPASA